MKLSEAIRKGATLRPQAHNFYFRGDAATCALGAAMEGARPEWVAEHLSITGIDEPKLLMDELRATFPVLTTPVTPSEMYELARTDDQKREIFQRFIDQTLWRAVTFLNDNFGWSREKIADWLEQKGY